jgi:hypothetical protein
MLSKGSRRPLCETDVVPLAALGGFEYVADFWFGQRAPDLQGSSFEVQVFPFEALQLATTEPSGNGYDAQGFEPVTTDRLKENAYLFAVEGPYLLPP